MTSVVERVVSLFIAPPRAVEQRGARSRMASATVAVVGGREAADAAAVVARGIVRSGRATVGVVALWGRTPPRRPGPASPAAAALAGKLRARGAEARAQGRLVVVGLPDEEIQAVAAFERSVAAAAGGEAVPVVLALCAARGEVWEQRLGGFDVALVTSRTGGDELTAQVARDRLNAAHPALTAATAVVAARFGPLLPRAGALVAPVLEALR